MSFLFDNLLKFFWLNNNLSHPFDFILFIYHFSPRTAKVKKLDDNAASLKVKLTAADMKDISNAVLNDEVAGIRIHQGFHLHTWTFAKTPPKESKISAQDAICKAVL